MSPSEHPHVFIALYLAVAAMVSFILLAVVQTWTRFPQPPKANPLKNSAHECELASRGQLHIQFSTPENPPPPSTTPPVDTAATRCRHYFNGAAAVKPRKNGIAARFTNPLTTFNRAAAVKPRKAGGLDSSLLVCLQRSRRSVVRRFVRGHHRREWLAPLSTNARREKFQAHPNTPQADTPNSAIAATMPFAISLALGASGGRMGTVLPLQISKFIRKNPKARQSKAFAKPARNQSRILSSISQTTQNTWRKNQQPCQK
jgi:hypothetical protein